MKLLTESLPQSDLQKICLLLAAIVPVPVVKLFLLNEHFGKESTGTASNDINPRLQIITAVQPVDFPDFKPADRHVEELIHETGKILVINDLQMKGVKNQKYHRMAALQLQLTLPNGLFVENHYEGLILKSLDSHDLPALETIECPAVLCLAGTEVSIFSESDINNIQELSGMLELVVNQWTQIQHEQQRIRKLKHDLRTPLTSMTMLPDIIKSAPGIDAESESMCEQMKIAARKLDLILAGSAT